MLSLGAAAFVASQARPISTFEINLQRLEGAVEDPSTMDWWMTQERAWIHATQDPLDPKLAINKFIDWVKAQGNYDPVMVVYPAWDYMWMHWYITRFYGKNPFGLGCLDLKSAVFGSDKKFESFKRVAKNAFPGRWFEDTPVHNHFAVDDAVEQGMIFMKFLQERK